MAKPRNNSSAAARINAARSRGRASGPKAGLRGGKATGARGQGSPNSTAAGRGNEWGGRGKYTNPITGKTPRTGGAKGGTASAGGKGSAGTTTTPGSTTTTPASAVAPATQPFLTPGQQRALNDWNYSYSTSLQKLQNTDTQAGVTEQQGLANAQKASTVNAENADQNAAARGLFESSIHDGALNDIASTLAQQQNLMRTNYSNALINDQLSRSDLQGRNTDQQAFYLGLAVNNAQAVPPVVGATPTAGAAAGNPGGTVTTPATTTPGGAVHQPITTPGPHPVLPKVTHGTTNKSPHAPTTAAARIQAARARGRGWGGGVRAPSSGSGGASVGVPH